MNDVNPTVSILCLCYNQQMFVVESLESIKAQSYQNFEILICDDFSKDNSVETIEHWIQQNAYLNIQFIKHSENIGITKTLNELLYLSQGKYIQLLALDDILMPDKLERHIEFLEGSAENTAMVFSDAHLMGDESQRFQNKFIAMHLNYLSLTSQNYYKMLLAQNFIPAMSALIKKEVLTAENGWDESLPFEDYDMWLRLSKKYNFLFDEKISCTYRLHENNSHKKRNVINRSAIFRVLIKHKEVENIRKIIFPHLEVIYKARTLEDENKIFYDYYPIKKFSERFIKNNWNPKLYVAVKEFERLLNILR